MRLTIFSYLLFLLLGLQACDEPIKDNQTSGSIKISVDETYKPVMENQLKVFLGRFPNAKIKVEYKPESDCIQDFFNDTTRVIFITRQFTEDEKKTAYSKEMEVQSKPMVRDAIAFITSRDFKNPYFKLADLKQQLQGLNNPKNYQFVFDNKGSSTVRYVSDSLLKGKKLGENIFATKSSEEVIDYVSKNDDAIGIIGVSWVANQSDSTTETFLDKIQVAGVWGDSDSAIDYIKPYQAYIGLRDYPCTRNFYFVSKESWIGLGTGFCNFLCRDGQLIFKQAKLFPLQVQVFLREAQVIQ